MFGASMDMLFLVFVLLFMDSSCDTTTRKPAPPPLETLPRHKIPPPPIEPVKPTIMEQMSSMPSLTDPQSSRTIRHEINSMKKIPSREPIPAINRPKLPEPHVLYCTEPNVIPEKPTTLPKKCKSTCINKKPLLSMSVPRSDVDKNELMEKLKRRQLCTAAAPMPPPKPYVRNDYDDSDDEWTIEPLKPINLYNI
ncbi:unnamed protein product [Euphydryas editha]|uniref:Uncharacterized protein n=1 Tax=Euphydryas editha TaxID=104508 RepID=A0AAU9UY80_EUPED|nr:unnamed protein product [Euphydryas editha]